MADSVVERARNALESDYGSRQYRDWYEQAKLSYDFYEGRHFSREEESELRKRGQPIVPVNKIAVNLDSIVGQEITSRTRIGFSPRS